MKATGIVRRIDDLGRVVIPKEIRRTLRIREGDPLEIFTDRDGGVILKKYSPIGELTDFSKEYAEALQQSTGHIILISDNDAFISVMDKRKSVVLSATNKNLIPIHGDDDESKYSGQVIAPILAEGDAIGSVVILSKEGKALGEVEQKLAETAAAFLGKQMEQ